MTGGPAFEREASYDPRPGGVGTRKPLDAYPSDQTALPNVLRAPGAVPPRSASIADITRFVDKIQQLERLERDHLLTLAAMGATDEVIAEAAITMTVARFPSPPPPGSLGWGATPAEVGRAVVEALRLCGRMPKTQDQQRGDHR